MNDDLLFYDAYEDFYRMAGASPAFRAYCREAFGADFSQDGFSDLWQVQQILPYIPKEKEAHVLDIGCGNGKMLGYLQQQSSAFIHGFDYSRQAIQTAHQLFPERSDFQVGLIGQQEYPANSFDTVISMDTLYFAPDMTLLAGQIRRWLKPGGVFFAGYQEGDVIPRTAGWENSLLAVALRTLGWTAQVTDITRQTWELLRRKRQAALSQRVIFAQEGHQSWFELLIQQTDCAMGSYEHFAQNFARYLVVARK
ncbi:MAG: class I SAM-dependent methyltransferase [Clostridia bacterium]|nr:class I SAM-dependent methyltransferase [Clostridia bacterium]MBP3649785.1 class I SAM-dependent methyltransferase [Clostridia bacterium]